MKLVDSILDFAFHLRGNLVRHDFSEFLQDDLPYLILGNAFSFHLLSIAWLCICFLDSEDVLLNLGQQACLKLLFQDLLLLQKKRSNRLFDLFFDHLWKGLLHSL